MNPEEVAQHTSISTERRYDIDWLRVIAIGILLVFHIMIMYQSYANHIRFIQSPTLLEILAIPLALFSVMRVPLLFFVSGMGVAFSLRRRTWGQFIWERTLRIFVPLAFGSLAIVPIHYFIYSKFYSEEFAYTFDVGHLWFLMNIFMYILWFLAIFYFVKEYRESRFISFLGRFLDKHPIGICIFAVPYILQALTIPSDIPYSLFYDPRVGLALGAIAFLLGFTFITIGNPFWKAVSKVKFYTLGFAAILFLDRILILKFQCPHWLTSIESISWILAIMGIGYSYLNKPSKLLSYLNPAAYPIYIVHMAFFYWAAYIIFPLNINPWLSLLFIVVFTFAGCFLSYEIIKRVFFLRPLFGLKFKK